MMKFISTSVFLVVVLCLGGFSGLVFSQGDELSVQERQSQLQTYLEEHVNDLPTLLELASLEGRAGDEVAMLEYLNQATNAHPNAIEPRLVLGRYYLVQKNPKEAEAVLSVVAPIANTNPNFLNALAAAQFQNENYLGARGTLESLAKFEPDKSSVFYLQARVYAELNEPELTQRALERTVELDAFHFPARLALARLLLAQGKTDAARVHVELLQAQAGDQPDVIRLVETFKIAEKTPAR